MAAATASASAVSAPRPPPPPVDTSSLMKRLTSLAEVDRALADVAARERAVDARLQTLLGNRAELEAGLAAIEDDTKNSISALRSDAQHLAESIASTAALSERVSRKVRQLDAAQSRVREALTHIDAAVGRAEAVEGLRRAMATDDYEAAAAAIAAFSDLEERFLATPTASAGATAATTTRDDRAVREQHETVAAAREKLSTVVRARLEAAANSGNHENVLRFIRLHRPLGLAEEGKAWFAAHLRKLVAKRAQEAYDVLMERTDVRGDDFVSALTSLFRDIGSALDANRDAVVDTFGQLAMLDVAAALHAECDVYGARVLRAYSQHRRLGALMQQTNALQSPEKSLNSSLAASTTAAATAAAAVDPRQVEQYLDEVLVLAQLCDEYNQYVLAAMAEATAPEPLGAARENTFRSGMFNQTVRELLSYYIQMEEYYMDRNVKTAISIDEWTPGAPITSMVDDVFFIVQKCGRRGLSTSNVQCACAVLSQGNTLLATELRAALDASWKPAALRLIQLLVNSVDNGVEPGNEAAAQGAVLNNLGSAETYTAKLRDDLDAFSKEVFPLPSDRERVQSILQDLNKTSRDFYAIGGRAVEQLSGLLIARVRMSLEKLASASYTLTEAAYAANELADTWVQLLLLALITSFQFLSPLLSPEMFESLAMTTLDKIVERIEAVLRLKRFNQLGGLQLDRDVRMLVATLSEVVPGTVRERFGRLSEMSTLLSFESPTEILDYSSVSWKLTETQIREVLSQRFDFDQREITALQL